MLKLNWNKDFSEYSSIPRLSKENNISDTTFSRRLLVDTSKALDLEFYLGGSSKYDIFHKDVWAKAYPDYLFTNAKTNTLI
jgi:hypothetical protein